MRFEHPTDKTQPLDNAVMIAWTALERFRAGKYDDLDIDIRPVWSIEDLHNP